MNTKTDSKAKRPVTTIWNEAEVAKRALELHDLEFAAKEARHHMLNRARDFKEKHGINHVDLNDPKFRRFTAKALAGVIESKRETRKARTRLLTACRRCPRVAVPRLKTPLPRMSARTANRLFGE
jgi:hypothetical protein